MRWSIAMATMVALGCSGSTAPANHSVQGVYALQSVNGHALPAAISHTGGWTVQAISETVTFTVGGAFIEAGTVKTPDGTEDFRETGTYTESNGAITITLEDGQTIPATIAQSTLAILHPSYARVYVQIQ